MRWNVYQRLLKFSRVPRVIKIVGVCCILAYVIGLAPPIVHADVEDQIIAAEGQVTLLRVHDIGTGYGPPSDFLDVEVIVQLDTQPGQSFGFQLRNDDDEAARQGMVDVLRTAFNTGAPVRIDFIDTGSVNSVMFRVAVLPLEEEYRLYLPQISR